MSAEISEKAVRLLRLPTIFEFKPEKRRLHLCTALMNPD
jgi:hypothetical protein